MATTAHTQIDRDRIGELAAREEKQLNAETQGSGRTFERAQKVLSSGVASSYQLRDPWPIYLEKGVGAYVWDVDGNKMIDFHNGFGSMVQGHAHPAITKAVTERIELGTHFAAPDRGRDRRRRGAAAPLGPAAVALRQLGLRGDHGRDPHRPRPHRPRHDHEDLRVVPRPPRLRDGLDRRPVRPDRRPRELRLAALRRRHPRRRRADDRARCRSTTPTPWSAASSA